MIIAEGPDGGGKSRLLRAMEQRTGRKPFHFGGPPSDLNKLIQRFNFVLSSPTAQVFDRVPFISEAIYREALHCRELLSPSNYWKWVDCLRDECSPLIVYCRPDEATIFHNIERAFDRSLKEYKSLEFINQIADNIGRIIKIYDRTIVQFMIKGLNIYPYNFKLDAIEDTLEIIEGVESLLETKRSRNVKKK